MIYLNILVCCAIIKHVLVRCSKGATTRQTSHRERDIQMRTGHIFRGVTSNQIIKHKKINGVNFPTWLEFPVRQCASYKHCNYIKPKFHRVKNDPLSLRNAWSREIFPGSRDLFNISEGINSCLLYKHDAPKAVFLNMWRRYLDSANHHWVRTLKFFTERLFRYKPIIICCA